jgi:hypothetical protein
MNKSPPVMMISTTMTTMMMMMMMMTTIMKIKMQTMLIITLDGNDDDDDDDANDADNNSLCECSHRRQRERSMAVVRYWQTHPGPHRQCTGVGCVPCPGTRPHGDPASH